MRSLKPSVTALASPFLYWMGWRVCDIAGLGSGVAQLAR